MEQEIELSLSDMIAILLKRFWIIVLCVVIGTVASFGISAFVLQKQYTASVQMYVSPNKDDTNPMASMTELTYAQAVVNTYIEILKTTSFLESVAKHTKLDLTAEDLKTMIEINAVNDTEIFEVKVEYPDPKGALLIANTVAKLAPQKIIDIKNADAVRVVDPARLPEHPSSPSVLKNTAIGAFLSMTLSVLIIFLLEMLDRRIKDEDDIVREFQLPILGTIPKFEGDGREE